MLREGAEALEKKKCVIAMSCILSTGEKCRRQLAGLERMGAANPSIPCVLVGDFLCGGRSDSREVVLQTLKEGIERLNERGGGFAAVVRLGSGEPRERKRGALLRNKKSALLISDPTCSFYYTETVHQLRAQVERAHEKDGRQVFLITSCAETFSALFPRARAIGQKDRRQRIALERQR